MLANEEAGWASEAVPYTIVSPHHADPATLETATERQKEEYFYPILRGEREGCGACTEPNAGGDAAGIQARAVKAGDHYVLNGTKIFVTNADNADFVLLGAVTGPAKPRHEKYTQFIIDFGTQGLKLSFHQHMMGRHGRPGLSALRTGPFIWQRITPRAGPPLASRWHPARLSSGCWWIWLWRFMPLA